MSLKRPQARGEQRFKPENFVVAWQNLASSRAGKTSQIRRGDWQDRGRQYDPVSK